MPQILAVALGILLLAGLGLLVRLEYKRSRKGPRMMVAARTNEETVNGPAARTRQNQHEIGY
jgi:hypothetical protein